MKKKSVKAKHRLASGFLKPGKVNRRVLFNRDALDVVAKSVQGQSVSSPKDKLIKWVSDFIEHADLKLNSMQCALRFRDAIEDAFKD